MNSSTSPSGLLARGEEIQAFAERLLSCQVIAVDAEMDSFYSYQTKLCLIQISTAHEDVLIDPLAPVDLSPLRAVFEHPGIVKILHAADNDVPYLVERVGGRVGPVFDTHVAARLLGLPRAGLGGLLTDFLGLEVDKTFQRADWRLRPLPQAQFDYAQGDTRYLIQIWKILDQMLKEQGLEEEAWAAFGRTNQSPPQPRKFNPHAFLQLPETRKLSLHHKARLRDLFRWRDDKAREQDDAVFRVLPDGLIVPLCLFEGGPDELRAHFRHHTIQRNAAELCRLLADAANEPFLANSVPAPEPFLRGRQMERYEKLRHWRNRTADALGIESDRVFTNRSLKALVLAQPQSRDELANIEGMEDWRLAKFGEALWSEHQRLTAR
ncbi:HRDC domain-containing protein [bacterium]|nr:HRDC domain-containing protein [bacterium]